MLYYVILCYAMLCRVMSYYVMLQYFISCHLMLCNVISCHLIICYAMSSYVILCYVISLYDILFCLSQRDGVKIVQSFALSLRFDRLRRGTSLRSLPAHNKSDWQFFGLWGSEKLLREAVDSCDCGRFRWIVACNSVLIQKQQYENN